MWHKIDIARIAKLLLLLAVAMFMLTACAGDDKNPESARAAISSEVNEDDAAAEQAKCWQNFIIDLLYDSMGKVALSTYTKITNGALTFMMVAFAVWLSFRLLKHVGSFTEENIGETWTEITRKLFLCLVCGYIASSTESLIYFMNLVIFPVYSAFLEFASQLLSKASIDKSTAQSISVFGMNLVSVGQPILCKLSSAQSTASLDGFPSAPKEMMDCMVCAMNERMNLGIAMAYTVLKAPGFMATVIGLMIIACFTFVKLGFVFYLVDSIFRFTVMIIMLPILIMGYPFKVTKNWLSFGFLTIINSAAFMMFMAVMIAITMLALEQIILDNRDIFIEGKDTESFKEFSIPFMCLLMIGFLIASSIKLAQQVTDALVGGNSQGSFNAKAKAAVVGIAKGAVSLGSLLGGQILKRSKAGRAVMDKYRGAKGKLSALKSKLNSFRGRE